MSHTPCLLGHRWVETGYRVWQLGSKSRRFRGCVFQHGGGGWIWHTGFGGREQGEAKTRLAAMREVEKARGE